MFKKKVTQTKEMCHVNNSLEVIKEETVYYFFFIPVFKSSKTVALM